MMGAQMSAGMVHGFALLRRVSRDSLGHRDMSPSGHGILMPDADATTPSDADLLRLSADGDKDAFSILYDRFSRPLFSLILKILSNPSEAEDVVQEVFIELWSKAADFDAARAQPFTLAVSIARNKAIDRIRTRTRRGGILEQSADDIAMRSLSTTEADARDAASASESAKVVRGAFSDLPSDQKTAIELAFFEGLTQSEIADRLSQPLGTVKARIRRGMLRMRERLAGRV
jgi:RNA polymerase sigma-70 factor, ECF subfamily